MINTLAVSTATHEKVKTLKVQVMGKVKVLCVYEKFNTDL